MADAEAEAKDNFTYLQDIHQSYQVLYKGSAKDMINALPSMMSGIHTMHDMSRYRPISLDSWLSICASLCYAQNMHAFVHVCALLTVAPKRLPESFVCLTAMTANHVF